MFEARFLDFTASTGLPVTRILAIFSLNSMIDIGFAQQYLLKIAPRVLPLKFLQAVQLQFSYTICATSKWRAVIRHLVRHIHAFF